ncbi:MAG TPA: Gfo/Idh/MocA family oxidoreductase [Chitinophagaceae bacterium]|nr:Gfo/Idh/MocA family oxidoreductase [Chitinophagaceae bacterium]
MIDTIRTALVGFGISGQVFHAPFLTTIPGYQLVSVLERHSSFSGERYPGIRICRTMEECIADPELDLIIITTPTESHFSLAAMAIEAGKHVVVEKPFTVNPAEAIDLIKLAIEKGVVLSVYQNRRYTGDFRAIQKILHSGILGDIAEFEAHYDRYRLQLRSGAWREMDLPGSGILFDLGAHLIDQALCLFGSPLTITANIKTQRPGAKVTDYFDLRLGYDLTEVRLKSGMLVREPGPRYQVHGTLGSYVKYGEDPQEALLRSGQLPLGPDWGMELPDQWGILHTEKQGVVIREPYPTPAGNFGDYYRELYLTLTAGHPLPIRPEEAYNTIRLISLAMESSSRGRTMICTNLL